ncbi:MAG TPA: hydantoinase/oxoprolinase family protein [Terriglobia bacterium]|nr:hydantoinase/oxoprolinase family protein [Terriglobia bacterium]
MRIGIDTGGTFTDCVYTERDRLRVLKVLSTPRDPAEAVLTALNSIRPRVGAEIRHGTTVGTNTLLERTGARVAFVTTAGFEDTIAIGRQARPSLYNWFVTVAPPLVPDELRFGVKERTLADGTVLIAPARPELHRLTRALHRARVESIALSFLFSFANPANEQAVESALSALDVPVSPSHRILPEFREYERAATLAVNAYLAPKMGGYLACLESSVRSVCPGARLQVMQSSGGAISAAFAAREPVRTVLSGPAGGLVGACEMARRAGYSRILSFDMGGTSTDVALAEVNAGQTLSASNELQLAGLPVAVPMLNIHTVGAGGGSVAHFDAGGALQVGPESAASDPGPICYGRGNHPTVTDANLLLGRLQPSSFLGGRMALNEARAREHFEETKGSLDTVEAFAEGIVRVAEATMEKALRVISVGRGYDPREFTLVTFGGAGPLHACALARSLRIPRVLVPRMPGALSAIGVMLADVVRDYSRTVMLAPASKELESHFLSLEKLGRREMKAEGFKAAAVRTLDMRYVGQGYELNVDWSADFVGEFHRAHERRYGYSDRLRPVEVVNVRARMVATGKPIPFLRKRLRRGDGRQAIIAERRIFYQGRFLRSLVYDRALLRAGDEFAGPAIVVEYSATAFLPPRCALQVDAWENMLIKVICD